MMPVCRFVVTMLAWPDPFRVTVSFRPGPVKVTVPVGIPTLGIMTGQLIGQFTGALDGCE
ncbi:hypothetical protein D3C81_2166040 [compost metagenome]